MLRELSLFSGSGGGLLGTKLLGFEPVAYVEKNAHCVDALEARIRDGLLPPGPIFGDVRSFLKSGDCALFAGRVDLVSAGFPCQPFSYAGKLRRGEDDRNLWPETAEVLRVIRPPLALLENVPGLLSAERLDLLALEPVSQSSLFDGLHSQPLAGRVRRRIVQALGLSYFGTVLRDLSELGFSAEWTTLGASDVGAPHGRRRLWVLAYQPEGKEIVADYARRSRSREKRPS